MRPNCGNTSSKHCSRTESEPNRREPNQPAARTPTYLHSPLTRCAFKPALDLVLPARGSALVRCRSGSIQSAASVPLREAVKSGASPGHTGNSGRRNPALLPTAPSYTQPGLLQLPEEDFKINASRPLLLLFSRNKTDVIENRVCYVWITTRHTLKLNTRQ